MATRLLHLEPSDSSAYVLLSNTYSTANQWDHVADPRKMMNTKKVRKDTGYSWIGIKNKVHLFVVDLWMTDCVQQSGGFNEKDQR